MTARMRIMDSGGLSVSFETLNEEWAQRNHDQSLARLNERGGLGACEALAIIERRPWHPMDKAAALAAIRRHAYA